MVKEELFFSPSLYFALACVTISFRENVDGVTKSNLKILKTSKKNEIKKKLHIQIQYQNLQKCSLLN